ncbi:SCO family protein [Symbiobacterium terraclitae]|uniref:SCO family protein n=1 Tax=Symbiobacterium terraclitae TaxID=557451 RepID=UPI0035B54694
MVHGAAIPRGVRLGLVLSTSLVVLSLAGLLALRWSMSRPALPVFGQVPAFQMVDQDGRPVTESDLRGRIHLVGFIYTSCPDICPAITAQMAGMQAELARAGLSERVHLLSITVDPEYDTPERLAAYAGVYGADTRTWRFLTGRPNHVRSVVEKGFLVGMEQVPTSDRVHAGHRHADAGAGGHSEHGEREAAPDYRVEHGGRLALVDAEGRIRAYHDGNLLNPDDVMAQIRLLLAGR